MASRRHAGFTLIEVMIALAIVALGMTAVQTQLNRYVVTAAVTEEKTLASWIAANELAELSVQPTWPELGSSTDDVEFAQREWRLEIDVSETEVENLRRVDVTVFLVGATEREIHTASALLEPPPPAGYMPVRWLSGGVTGAGG
jgi:general secretion pathway protein I